MRSETVYESVSDLPTNYLTCRTFGHQWEEFVPVGMRKPQHSFRFSLLCVSCGTERHDLLNLSGQLTQREYRYAEGYQVKFKMSRDECRVALNKRKKRTIRRGNLTAVV